MNHRLVLTLVAPVVGSALIIGAILLRAGPEAPPTPTKAVAANVSLTPSVATASPPLRPRPAPERTVALAMDEARLKTTYQNYRTAIATGNEPQSEALYRVLVRERASAVKLAEADCSQAREEFDRSLARKALETLRR